MFKPCPRDRDARKFFANEFLHNCAVVNRYPKGYDLCRSFPRRHDPLDSQVSECPEYGVEVGAQAGEEFHKRSCDLSAQGPELKIYPLEAVWSCPSD